MGVYNKEFRNPQVGWTSGFYRRVRKKTLKCHISIGMSRKKEFIADQMGNYLIVMITFRWEWLCLMSS